MIFRMQGESSLAALLGIGHAEDSGIAANGSLTRPARSPSSRTKPSHNAVNRMARAAPSSM